MHMPGRGLTDEPLNIRLGIVGSFTGLQALQTVLELDPSGCGVIVDIITYDIRGISRRGSRIISVASCRVQAGRGT